MDGLGEVQVDYSEDWGTDSELTANIDVGTMNRFWRVHSVGGSAFGILAKGEFL